MVKDRLIILAYIVLIMDSDPSDQPSDDEEDDDGKKKILLTRKKSKKRKASEKKSKQLSKQELRRVNQLFSKKYTNERKNFQEVVDQIRSEGAVDTDSESDPSKQLHYRWLYKNLKPNKATEPQSVEYTKRMKRWLKHTKNKKEGRFFFNDTSRAAIEDIPSDQVFVEPETQPLSEEDALERWKLCKSQLKTREWFHIKLMELADKRQIEK